MTPTDSLLFFCFADSIGSKVFCYTFVMFCDGVVCVYWGVLSYKYKYIYFALQKNNKKNKHEINDSRGMLLSLQAGCLFFFSSALTLHNKRERARPHRFTRTRPFERSPVNGCRADSDPGTAKMLGCHREAVTLPHVCDTWSKGGTSERNALAEGGPLVRKVTSRGCVRARAGFMCVSVCVGDNCLKNTI